MDANSKVKPLYEPWEGKQYRDSPHRLLLLGESHYGEYAKSGDATVKLTQEYVEGEINHAFWTNIQSKVSGRSLSVCERAGFWHAVALYNFVQESAGATAGVAPTDAAFSNSKSAFFTILDQLKPHAILVLSTRLWNHLPGSADGATQVAPLVVEGKEREAWLYYYEGGSALASWVPHPSRYFDVSRWRPWVQELVRRSS